MGLWFLSNLEKTLAIIPLNIFFSVSLMGILIAHVLGYLKLSNSLLFILNFYLHFVLNTFCCYVFKVISLSVFSSAVSNVALILYTVIFISNIIVFIYRNLLQSFL